MHRTFRNSKYDPLVDKVDLLEDNPQCAHAKLAEGRETNVSLKQLAMAGISSNKKTIIFNHIGNAQDVENVENVPQVTEDARIDKMSRIAYDIHSRSYTNSSVFLYLD